MQRLAIDHANASGETADMDQSTVNRGSAAQALIGREMRVAYGTVGNTIDGLQLGLDSWLIRGDEFLLHMENLSMRYRKGEGVTIERRAGARDSEEALFLNGSVYAAVACINGFYPMHASAVAHDGGVHAFTGPTGAGKSTLVTALGGMGLSMFCDDTLILDLSDPQVPLALPGHKRLKLTADALALTGAAAEEPVDELVDKFYALPPAGDCCEPLPLRQLVFLEEGPDLVASAIAGAEKVARLSDEHHVFDIHQHATGMDPAERFALQGRLARQITMARLARPRDRARFGESVALACNLVCSVKPAA